MDIYTIYDHPIDYPEHYVCRRHVVHQGGKTEPDTELFSKSRQLAEIQYTLSRKGMFRIRRDPEDDPKIIESWL